MSTIQLSISSGQVIQILNITYASELTLNLLSLKQLQKSNIIYYNNNEFMILKKDNNEIT